jgi:hypothetical protein
MSLSLARELAQNKKNWDFILFFSHMTWVWGWKSYK